MEKPPSSLSSPSLQYPGANDHEPTLDSVVFQIATRFITNLPNVELQSFERLFVQLEQAHWYYEDFFSDKYTHIPHMKLKVFCRFMFNSLEFLRPHVRHFEVFYLRFRDYLGRVPVCGAILINPAMTHAVMCRSHQGKSWSFPKGKMNENELEHVCAAREVREETGYDCSSSIVADRFVSYELEAGKSVTLFIITNVPQKFKFAPLTRKEISEIMWVPLAQILGLKNHRTPDKKLKCWQVQPIVGQLREWLVKNGAKVKRAKKTTKSSSPRLERNRTPSNLTTFGSTMIGWSAEEMFETNQRLFGITSSVPPQRTSQNERNNHHKHGKKKRGKGNRKPRPSSPPNNGMTFSSGAEFFAALSLNEQATPSA